MRQLSLLFEEPVAKAVDVAESLLEYAGISESHARALLNWIDLKFNGEVDPEVFWTEPEFAEARQLAYIAFVEGNAR